MKFFAIGYLIVALIVSVTTTILQIQPALFLIEPLTGSDNKFSATLVVSLLMLAFMIPLLMIALFVKSLNKKKNEMPDTTGKTGIIVHRKKALSNALYDAGVLVNGELKSSVSSGKSTFIELPWGKYNVQIKGQKAANLDVEIPRGKIIDIQLAFIDDGGLKIKVVFEVIEDYK